MNPDIFLSSLGEWFEARGYRSVRCSLELTYNRPGETVIVFYTDLLGERHFQSYSRLDGESLADWFDRINQKAAELPPADAASAPPTPQWSPGFSTR